jgi:hypothetical protein
VLVKVKTLRLSGDMAFVANQFNADGIVARHGWPIVVQSNTGLHFRVDPVTGVTRKIDLGGARVASREGLELHGSTLYVVRTRLDHRRGGSPLCVHGLSARRDRRAAGPR